MVVRAKSGLVTETQYLRASISDLKQIAQAYNIELLYAVRIKSVKPGKPGYRKFMQATLGFEFTTHGNA
jgi:hypothetical protein